MHSGCGHRRSCRKLNEGSLFGGHTNDAGNAAAAQAVRLLVLCRDCQLQVEPDPLLLDFGLG